MSVTLSELTVGKLIKRESAISVGRRFHELVGRISYPRLVHEEAIKAHYGAALYCVSWKYCGGGTGNRASPRSHPGTPPVISHLIRPLQTAVRASSLPVVRFVTDRKPRGTEQAPNLLRSPLVFQDHGGDTLGPFLKVGRPTLGMPAFPTLEPAQVQDISAFLHDRIQQVRGTRLPETALLVGDPKAGLAYFIGAGKCSTCHSATGDLAHIGSKEQPLALTTSFLTPPAKPSQGDGDACLQANPLRASSSILTSSRCLSWIRRVFITLGPETGQNQWR